MSQKLSENDNLNVTYQCTEKPTMTEAQCLKASRMMKLSIGIKLNS